MNYQKFLPVCCFLLLSIFSSEVKAQDFDSLVNNLNSSLQKVENGKYEYSQKSKVVQPGVVQLSIIKTTLKDGKTSESLYEFNLADIDENTVRTVTNKDIIQVQLLSSKKQNLIKETIDNEKISYINEILVYASDIDNGRALEKNITALIPVAIKITEERLSLSTYQQYFDWISNNVTDVNLIKKQFAQKVNEVPAYPGRVAFSVTENSGKSSKSSEYQFNLMTINPNSILFSISGEVFAIEMETRRKLKTVKLFEEGEQQNYTNKLRIICNSVETARDLQKVLKELIPLAKVEFDKSIKKPATISEAIQNINTLSGRVNVNETSINQDLNGDCIATFLQTNVSAKKTASSEYTFNFKDLNKNGLIYSTKGKFVFLDVATKGGAKFIKLTQDNEQKNYTDEFSINAPEIEDAIALQTNLESLIEMCLAEKETYAEGSKKELIDRMGDNMSKVTINNTTYEQSLQISDDYNSLVFRSIEVTPKSSEEKVYDFNLTDLNPASVKMETSGKNVTVSVTTYYLEKIIKYYEDGEIENYQNAIEIQANSIENARIISTLLKKVAGKDE